MASSDVSIPQDGGAHVKLHPYLITLVRWCVSCLWSTATVFLHRLMSTPLPSITAGSKPVGRVGAKSRPAGTEHLHPEPRVECVELHAPATPTVDVVFVHGLYGSLGNTWRQGEWRTKYKLDPIKVPLRNHPTEICSCFKHNTEHTCKNTQEIYAYETNLNETNLNEKVTFNQISGCFKKILPNENSLITEQFYNNTLINVDVENYGTQAKFVSELFKNDCDKNCDLNTFKCNYEMNKTQCNCEEGSGSKCKLNEQCKLHECQCKLNVTKCEAGCGCVCDECYSSCWPRDWIKEDFPGARVISINYTSDPYLWRPLWVKGNKRLRLQERAEQMTRQLVALGVGRRPLVWVGHSKGGLFIKQIYCEAYEAHLKLEKSISKYQSNYNFNNQTDRKNHVTNTIDNKLNIFNNTEAHTRNGSDDNGNRNNIFNDFINEQNKDMKCIRNGDTTLRSIDAMKEIRNNFNSGHIDLYSNENNQDLNKNFIDDAKEMMTEIDGDDKYDDDTEYIDISVRNDERIRNVETREHSQATCEGMSSNDEEDSSARARLWGASTGFMFYSVPHRGSPLADIKTPITSRSVELQEIAKDCPLVLDLQRRWLAAARGCGGCGTGAGRRGAAPQVRSLVETRRTLMSVLRLRIVSEESADAGVGSLHGVSVDHREVCKPSGRRCPLYTELADLIRAAVPAPSPGPAHSLGPADRPAPHTGHASAPAGGD